MDEGGICTNDRMSKHVGRMQFYADAGKKGAEKRWNNRGAIGEGITPANGGGNADKIREDKRREENTITTHTHNASAKAHDYPSSIEEVYTEADMAGLTREVADVYFDKRKATGFCVQRGEKMIFIQDWRADFRHTARYIQADLRKLSQTESGKPRRFMTKQDEIDEKNRIFMENIRKQKEQQEQNA
jgi:hypothetical protein